MTDLRQRCALLALVLCWPMGTAACELVLSEHRSQRVLLRLPMSTAEPRADVAFTHSVLGTPVLDRYLWRASPSGWRAHLVEERFDGEGYGLPSAPGPGEQLVRVDSSDTPAYTRLTLNRLVEPLVVRPLPEQHMRVLVTGQPAVLLGSLSTQALQLHVHHCADTTAHTPHREPQ